MPDTGSSQPLTIEFFARPALTVAADLLGSLLCRDDGTRRRKGRIVEVEAYTDDAASHARAGRRTPRNEVMFGPAGHAYVYFTYGIHFCFNIVTETSGRPGAVLVRGLDGIEAANGPARLCRVLGIGREHNRLDLTAGAVLWLERGEAAPRERVIRTTRIGIRQACELPWRLYLAGSPGVSRRDRDAENR